MRIRSFFSLLILVLLTGLLVGSISFPASARADGEYVIQISPSGHGRAHALAYSPDGKILAVGSSLGIHLFNSSDLQLLKFIPTDTWVRTLAISPDGSMLASGSYDTNVRLWRASDGTLLKELIGHTGWVRSLAFSPDGKWLATASDDDTVRLWNMPDGELLKIFDKNMEGLRTLAISPDGTILATGGYDKIIRFWNTSDGTLMRELEGHTDWVRTLAFSPDGEWLASGAFDATVRLWRVTDGELVVTRNEHSSSVLGLAFSLDGSFLASASVDTTVRLWEMPELEPYDLLRGHSDFVYSVAFSPDGKTLASGAVDNTARVWDVPVDVNPAAQERVSSPSNCKTCHHPHGLQGPPRVIETGCSICHASGARALNWCPAFARSPGETTMTVQLQPQEIPGYYHPTSSSTIIIHSPGNGEVIYGQSYISYPLKVQGRVYYQGNLSDLELTLEILSEDGLLSTVESAPLPDGTFSFLLEGNHGSTEPISLLRNGISIAGESPCLVCHKDQFEGNLPDKGIVRLKVIMSTSAGIQASDERVIFVDSGGVATIPVRVLLETGESIHGLSVRAESRLYEWRGRPFTAVSDAQGKASLQVEALSQNSTTYQISIPPTVFNGVLYESKESVQVVLPPGATSAPTVTVHVRTVQGEIHGQVNGLETPIEIRAISLPDGASHVIMTSSQGAFIFADLPVDEYLIAANPQALAQQGLVLEAKKVDLVESLSVEMNLIPQQLDGSSITGKITDESGTSLPFAWVSVGSRTGQADPASGVYEISVNEATATISAPGYYSQAHRIDTASMPAMDFSLFVRPETTLLPWGDGTIVIPPETVSSAEGQLINFEQGWLWGEGRSEEPLVIQWDDIQITIPGGGFALERLPAQAAWLYVFEGEATIQQGDNTSPVTVQAGEMAYLSSNHKPQPSSYDPIVVRALRTDESPAVIPIWQPSLSAQFRDRLARAGIGTAQFMTFITYLMALLILCVIPILSIKWLVTNRKERKHD